MPLVITKKRPRITKKHWSIRKKRTHKRHLRHLTKRNTRNSLKMRGGVGKKTIRNSPYTELPVNKSPEFKYEVPIDPRYAEKSPTVEYEVPIYPLYAEESPKVEYESIQNIDWKNKDLQDALRASEDSYKYDLSKLHKNRRSDLLKLYENYLSLKKDVNTNYNSLKNDIVAQYDSKKKQIIQGIIPLPELPVSIPGIEQVVAKNPSIESHHSIVSTASLPYPLKNAPTPIKDILSGLNKPLE